MSAPGILAGHPCLDSVVNVVCRATVLRTSEAIIFVLQMGKMGFQRHCYLFNGKNKENKTVLGVWLRTEGWETLGRRLHALRIHRAAERDCAYCIRLNLVFSSSSSYLQLQMGWELCRKTKLFTDLIYGEIKLHFAHLYAV